MRVCAILPRPVKYLGECPVDCALITSLTRFLHAQTPNVPHVLCLLCLPPASLAGFSLANGPACPSRGEAQTGKCPGTLHVSWLGMSHTCFWVLRLRLSLQALNLTDNFCMRVQVLDTPSLLNASNSSRLNVGGSQASTSNLCCS